MSLADKLADSIPTTNVGRMELGPDGGEFTDIKTDHPISDWSEVFGRFQLDPDAFEIVDDTVRMSTWQQSKRTDNGDRDVVNLYSYRASYVNAWLRLICRRCMLRFVRLVTGP